MQSSEEWWDNFQQLLDEQTDWPTDYTFKFIAPASELDSLKALFGLQKVAVRESSKGNYASVTATLEMHSSDEVIAMYMAAGKIPGVVSL